jgi:phospholipase D1/2
VRVAIARTEPQYDYRSEIREVEHLYLDMIKAARRFIYIETQYLTSNVVGAALEERLQEPDGPEAIIVLHPSSDGWLEQHTMDALRGRLLKRLRAADKSQRLALYCPHVPGLGDQCLSMHSKVCIVDEELARVGSANMSNRSMGFDTECDLRWRQMAIPEYSGASRNSATAC